MRTIYIYMKSRNMLLIIKKMKFRKNRTSR